MATGAGYGAVFAQSYLPPVAYVASDSTSCARDTTCGTQRTMHYSKYFVNVIYWVRPCPRLDNPLNVSRTASRWLA